MFNGNEKHVAGVSRSSSRRGRTARDVLPAEGSTTSNITGSAGTARTRRRAATKKVAVTTLGKAAVLPTTTANKHSLYTVTSASDVVALRYSSTTRTETDKTPTRKTSRFFVSGATNWNTNAQRTYLDAWSSSIVRAPSVTRGSAHQAPAVSTAKPAAEKEQRYSQCPRKRGSSTINYGMGATRLANQLGCSRDDAQKLIDRYMRTYPAVQNFFEEAVAETTATGYAFTILGRRRNVVEISSHRKDQKAQGERVCVNTQIQGSAADVCKMAQIHIDKVGLEERLGCKQLMQVHDEVVFECPKETVDQALVEICDLMEHPFSFDLPVHLAVDAGKGGSWGAAK